MRESSCPNFIQFVVKITRPNLTARLLLIADCVNLATAHGSGRYPCGSCGADPSEVGIGPEAGASLSLAQGVLCDWWSGPLESTRIVGPWHDCYLVHTGPRYPSDLTDPLQSGLQRARGRLTP